MFKATLFKKRFQDRCFPVNSAKFLRIPSFSRTPPVAAFFVFFYFDAFQHSKQNALTWVSQRPPNYIS